MKKFLIIIVFTFSINSVFADSPLTSTDFYKAYLDVPLVAKVSKSNGVLTAEVFDYLNSKSISIDKKIAVINALKWNIKGKHNATLYLKKLLMLHKDYTPANFYNKANAEELICYAYLKAMDNYFDVKKASLFSIRANKLNPNSYAIVIINKLITSQMVGHSDWCDIYTRMKSIKGNRKLTKDFRKKAAVIIFKYTDSYKEYCAN